MGQACVTVQFYRYGKARFTALGWEATQRERRDGDELESVDLQRKVFVITGANSGIGHEVARFLLSRGAKVHVICRNRQRGTEAVSQLQEQTKCSPSAVVLHCADCSLKEDVVRVCERLRKEEPQIHGLVCNAGALLAQRHETKEGHEVTFATHLAFGSVLLSRELEAPIRTGCGRVIFVSSGGMYNGKMPSWDVLASTGAAVKLYNGQMQYVYCKRAQVVIAEALAEQERSRPNPITYITAHPGWTDTPGVAAAYGKQAKYLQPLRTLWQGAEGICWLCATAEKVEPGAFYLDRAPQPKHLPKHCCVPAGFTVNSPEEVVSVLHQLQELCA
mmetsp:Transcript_66398/g.151939  ORF Transcript_66398/g.151939 Transcript_66398/m.151939 type:complete len:332 (+) Transcript_66398:2221-3216(+)